MTAIDELAAEVGTLALARGWTIGCAESLTSGRIATALGAAPDGGTWFRGAVVAYSAQVKHDVLGVPFGPVVSGPSAMLMARNAATLLSAELTVAVTGVGGPDQQDGWPVGTVFLAVHDPHGTAVEEAHFDGSPAVVVERTTLRAVQLLVHRLQNEAP